MARLRRTLGLTPAAIALGGVGLLLSTSSCTLRAYPGPRLEATEVAVLEPAVSSRARVVLEAVNGVELRWLHERVEVRPGPQRVRATLVLKDRVRRITGHHELEFHAQPGVTYTLYADWFLYGPRLRVSDSDGRWVAAAVTRPERLAPPPVGAR